MIAFFQSANSICSCLGLFWFVWTALVVLALICIRVFRRQLSCGQIVLFGFFTVVLTGFAEKKNMRGNMSSFVPRRVLISQQGNPQLGVDSACPLVVLNQDIALPTDLLPVTNLCIWCIEKGTNTLALGFAWPPFWSFPGNVLDIFGTDVLATNIWSRLGCVDVSNIYSNVIVEIKLEMFSSNRTNQAAFVRLADRIDSDFDGLTDAEECWQYRLNPYEPDTDGDGLNDGWEVKYGFPPTHVNTASSLSAFDDPDHDGLINRFEALLGTNPFECDTDNDGRTDGQEVPLIYLSEPSEPALPTPTSYTKMTPTSILDNFTNPCNPDNTSEFPIGFFWGDPSSSHSEKYGISINPIPNSGWGQIPFEKKLVNSTYGICDTNIVFLNKGWRYRVTLHQAGTDYSRVEEPDPDYVLAVVANTNRVVLIDPNNLFTLSDVTDGVFTANDKSAELVVLDDSQPVEVTIDGLKKGAILIHDSYEDAPGEFHAATSTVAKVKVRVNTPISGRVTLSAIGASGRLSASEILPCSWDVNGVQEREFNVSGLSASEAEDDIEFIVTFDSSRLIGLDTAKITVVKISSIADAKIPINQSRHVFGPGEGYNLISNPIAVEWCDSRSSKSRKTRMVLGRTASEEPEIWYTFVSCHGALLSLPFQVIPPMTDFTNWRYANRDSDWKFFKARLCPPEGVAGVGLVTQIKLKPEYVSFAKICLEENPSPPMDITGWYTNVPPVGCQLVYAHTALNGALRIIAVDEDNDAGLDIAAQAFDWLVDWPIYAIGHYMWELSCQWYVWPGGAKTNIPWSNQHFYVNSAGDMGIKKFEHEVWRSLLDIYRSEP